MQAFIDDSVEEGPGGMFVLAGFIGRAEDWAGFADRWQAVLGRPPRIPRFKFREFARGDGVFTRLSRTERKRKASELVATMAGGGFTRISMALDLTAFAEWSKTWDGTEISHPYCFTFSLVIGAVGLTLWDRKQTEPFEILFDEQLALSPRAKKWYAPIRELCMPREIQALLPPEPIFRKDEDCVALQAADLYAGLVRSGKGEKNAATEAPLSPLLAVLSGLRATDGPESNRRLRETTMMREQAKLAASAWEISVKSVGLVVAAQFIPIMERLKKSLADIGGDSISEQRLAPMFGAAERSRREMKPSEDSDEFEWLRRELRAVTAISGCPQWVGRDLLFGEGGSPRLPISDETLIRAIALMDEESVEGYRKKIAQRLKKGAQKAARRRHK